MATTLPLIVSSDCGPSKCSKSSKCSSNDADVNCFASLSKSCFETNKIISEERVRLALTNPNIVIKRTNNLCSKSSPHLTALLSHPRFVREQAPSSKRFWAGKSPYDLAANDLDKFFMSGYDGFIPKSRTKCGRSFPHISYDAIREFEDDRDYLSYMRQQPVAPMQPRGGQRGTRQSGYVVYRDDSGLIPHYTGHIPGHSSRYGGTFMNVTYDVLGKIAAGE